MYDIFSHNWLFCIIHLGKRLDPMGLSMNHLPNAKWFVQVSFMFTKQYVNCVSLHSPSTIVHFQSIVNCHVHESICLSNVWVKHSNFSPPDTYTFDQGVSLYSAKHLGAVEMEGMGSDQRPCLFAGIYGGFLKWWYPTTMGFLTKMIILGCQMGVPLFLETPI